MAGYLYVTEYNNQGDLSLETPLEPALAQNVLGIGDENQVSLHPDTRVVALFATLPCFVAFDSRAGFPLAPGVEVIRLVHMRTGLSVSVRERWDYSAP
jgi:hypothetical protein